MKKCQCFVIKITKTGKYYSAEVQMHYWKKENTFRIFNNFQVETGCSLREYFSWSNKI